MTDTLAASGASQTNQDREEEMVLAASIAREKEEKDLILLRLASSTMLCRISCPILSCLSCLLTRLFKIIVLYCTCRLNLQLRLVVPSFSRDSRK